MSSDDDEDQTRFEQQLAMIRAKLKETPQQYKQANFDPLLVTLELLQSPRREEERHKIQVDLEMVDQALELLVDRYYTGFNKSVHNFTLILERMLWTQDSLLGLEQQLDKLKHMLVGRSDDLKQLWLKQVEYRQMISILDKVEHLKQVPEKLERYTAGKHYLHAVNELTEAMAMINSADLAGVAAQRDLRTDLNERYSFMHQLLIEELHSHVYLRAESAADPDGVEFRDAVVPDDQSGSGSGASRWRNDSWTQFFRANSAGGGGGGGISAASNTGSIGRRSHRSTGAGGNTGSATGGTATGGGDRDAGHALRSSIGRHSVLDDGSLGRRAGGNSLGRTGAKGRHRRLTSFSGVFRVDEEVEGADDLVEDLNANPELDSRKFVRLLIQSLAVINKIPETTQQLQRRLPTELLSVIRKATDAVRDKYRARSPRQSDRLHIRDNAPLSDLLQLVFDKFSRILKNHAFVLDTIKMQTPSARAAGGRRDTLSMLKASADPGGSGSDSELDDSTTGTPRDASSYSLEEVWNVMQLQLESLLCEHLGAPKPDLHAVPRSKSGLFPVAATSSEILSPLELARVQRADASNALFSFSASAMMQQRVGTGNGDSFYSTHSLALSRTGSFASLNRIAIRVDDPADEDGDLALFQPSAYNITTIYKPVVVFSTDVLSMLGKEPGFKLTGIRAFLDDFVANTFLHALREDYSKRAIAVLENSNAFKLGPRHRPADSAIGSSTAATSSASSVPLLHAVAGLYDLLDELFHSALSMPLYLSEYVTVIVRILESLHARCLAKYAEATETVYSAGILKRPAYLKQMQQDPHWLALNRARDKGFDDAAALAQVEPDDATAFREAEEALEKPMWSSCPLARGQLITSSNRLQMLANLHQSLEWLATRLDSLGTEGLGDAAVHVTGKKRTVGRRTSSVPRRNRAQSRGAAYMASALEAISSKFRAHSERCIFTLRVELRTRCFYYLERMKGTSYHLEEEAHEPDLFVLQLAKDLSEAEEVLEPCLPPSKSRYLFYSLAQLVSEILIRGLGKLRRINGYGVSKMCRNLFALQQSLTNIIASQEEHFDRVRQYYMLWHLTADGLVAHVLDHPGMFTEAQYRAVLERMSPHRKTTESIMAEIRKQLQPRADR